MIVVDSDILIGFLRRADPYQEFLLELSEGDEELATTSLNMAEVLDGAYHDGRSRLVQETTRFLQGFETLPFGRSEARRFAQLSARLANRGRPLPTVDLMIAAIVLENGGRLATRNVRHYEPIAQLDLISP